MRCVQLRASRHSLPRHYLVPQVGKGPFVQDRKAVRVSYVGKLLSGKTFDKSGSKPLRFTLGKGEVIKGWDIGVAGMRVGSRRRITVPPKAGYGAQAAGAIPPNSTLVFNVTVVG